MIKKDINQYKLVCDCGIVHLLDRAQLKKIGATITAEERWSNASQEDRAMAAKKMVQGQLKKALKKNSKKRKSIVK